MANYYRQCPHCGGHTEETTCEICGRRTFSTSDVNESNINTPSTPLKTSQKPETKSHAIPAEGHLQKMLKEGRNYQKKPTAKTSSNKTTKFIVFGVLAILIPLLSTAFEDNDYVDNDYMVNDHIDQQFTYFQDYLVTVKDTTPLVCEIDKSDKQWFNLNNNTPYMFNAEVELETTKGVESSSFFYGTAQGYESDVTFDDIKTCTVTSTEYLNLNIYDSDIAYDTLYDDEYHKEIVLKKDVNEQDLETLLKRIYALQILSYETYDDTIHVMFNEDYKYEVEFNYDDAIIYITDNETQQKTVLELDIL